MNRTELVADIAKETGKTQQEVLDILESAFGMIKKTVQGGGKVQIAGFGTFECRTRKARNGVNPRTGEKITIPSAKVAKFAPAKAFKDLMG